jgi:hypothetical protein
VNLKFVEIFETGEKIFWLETEEKKQNKRPWVFISGL